MIQKQNLCKQLKNQLQTYFNAVVNSWHMTDANQAGWHGDRLAWKQVSPTGNCFFFCLFGSPLLYFEMSV